MRMGGESSGLIREKKASQPFFYDFGMPLVVIRMRNLHIQRNCHQQL